MKRNLLVEAARKGHGNAFISKLFTRLAKRKFLL